MPADPVGYVITQVAARTGQAVAAVFEEPYAVTLWVFGQLQEADRIARELARKARIEQARFVSFAMWKPADLDRIERELFPPGDGAAESLQEREARLHEMLRARRAPGD